MTPQEAGARISVESLASLRAHPAFRAACETVADDATRYFAALEPTYQWVTKDLGRSAISFSALVLHHMGRLTLQALTASCLANGVSSAGRVQQLVRRCLDVRAMILAEGEGVWTRRPLAVAPALVQALRGRAAVDVAALRMLAPEAEPLLRLIQTDDGFASYVLCIAIITGLRRDLFAFSQPSSVAYFLDREAGMTLLFDLIGAQSPDRTRFMQSAPLSRYALARRYGVSRAHINKLFAESGHIDAGPDCLTFSPELSEAMEAHFALTFELSRRAAEVLGSGWRAPPREVLQAAPVRRPRPSGPQAR
jgi:hypothetical protein